MPVWHASVSAWDRRSRTMLTRPTQTQQLAIEVLAGVGGDTEWWIYNSAHRVGHLRVPVTITEMVLVPPGCVIADAGATGPQRPRTILDPNPPTTETGTL